MPIDYGQLRSTTAREMISALIRDGSAYDQGAPGSESAGLNPLRLAEDLEIALAAHAGCPEQVPDDEHGDFAVHRNYEGAAHSRLDVDKVVADLSVEAESTLLKHPDQALEVNRAYGGHAVISCSS